MDSCIKHPHEHGVSHCGRCGGSWCSDCLVHAYGAKKPPLCMSCAMFAAGVRTHADRPALGRRELKALAKQAKSAGPEDGAVAEPAVPVASLPEADVVDDITAADRAVDWDSPWWENDREPTLTD
ncbi:MAG: hypothetical protein ACLGI8_12710 [Acidimicrobiia bacterium]|jgi:hypothetical protein